MGLIRNINLNTGQGYKKIVFPDSQPHIVLENLEDEIIAKVTCSIDSPDKILELMLVADAIKNADLIKSHLFIPYLMGARYDRVMNPGDSFDLRVIANVINSLEFDTVILFDPHSDVAPALINNVIVIDNRKLVEVYDKEDAVLIIPDTGAAKKAHKYFEWNKNLREEVHCIKHRDLSTGAISLKVLDPEKCAGKNCVIIDDICDGGGTFIGIAKDLRDKGYNPLSMTLIVTHGIFSKGLNFLAPYFDQIICSDSLGIKKSIEPPLKQIPFNYADSR